MAMYDAMIAMNERAVGMSAMLGSEILPGIPADLGSAPSGVFSAIDGFMSISVVGEGIWKRFCGALGRADWAADDRLQTRAGRAEHYETIIRPGSSSGSRPGRARTPYAR